MTTTATDPKRRALGKGLDSLLPRVPGAAAPSTPVPAESEGGKPREIPIEQIDRNPFHHLIATVSNLKYLQAFATTAPFGPGSHILVGSCAALVGSPERAPR